MARHSPAQLALGLTLPCALAMGALAQAPAARFELGAIEVLEVTGERDPGWFRPVEPAVDLETIRRFDRQDLAEAARLLPGVNIQNAGARNERLIFVRGFNSRQVPLFIDGIPVYVPYDGNIDLARFTTFDVAEVGVTKGFTSVLYGANTLGGSINVVTRRPDAGVSLDAGSGIGLDDEGDRQQWSTYLNAGVGQDQWYAQFGASAFEQDFFRLPADFEPTVVEDGGRRENSSARDLKVSLRLGFRPNAEDEYALSYIRQQGRKDTPPYAGTDPGVRARFWRWPEYDKESVYLIARKGLGSGHYLRARAFYDTFDNTLRAFDDASFTSQDRPFAFNSVYDDYSLGGSLEAGTTQFARHDLRAALHYKLDVHRETDDDGAPEERFEDATVSIGLEDRFAASDRLTIIGGLSWDALDGRRADNRIGNTITGFELASAAALNAQAGLVFALRPDLDARLSASRRTRFPTIKDRYSFRLGSALPNPDLEPETAVNVEAGLDAAADLADGTARLRFNGALFYSRLDDAVENVTLAPAACPQPPCFQLRNIGEQVNQGVEAAIGAQFGSRLEVHLNYTWLDRDNRTRPEIRPLDTPEHSLFGFVRLAPFAWLDLLASVEYGAERFSSTDGARMAESFVVAGLKATWRPRPALAVEAGIRNLFDTLYAYEEGFYEPGRTVLLTLRWSP